MKKRFFHSAGEKRKFYRNMQFNASARTLGFVGLQFLPLLGPLALVLLAVLATYSLAVNHETLAAHTHLGGLMLFGGMTSREMREKRAQIAKDMAELCKTTPLSAENRTKFDGLDVEQEQLRKDIEATERAAALEAEFRTTPGRQEDNPGGGALTEEQQAERKEKRYAQAYWSYMKNGLAADQHGFRGVSAEDKAVLSERRTTLSGTAVEGVLGGAYPSASTGFFVPVGFVPRVEEAMKWYGGMMTPGVAEVYETATGQPLPFPTDNDTTVSGELIAENTQVATAAVTWSQIVFGAFKFSTKLVPVSIELLQDSAFDLETYLSKKFGTRLGRILNTKFTIGVGTTEPMGIVVASTSSGQTVIGDDNATTPNPLVEVGYLDLVNLMHSVDIAYRQNAKWMMHDLTLAFIKKLKDKYGRPLWSPGLSAGAPDTILGKPYVVNNDMADCTTNSPAAARKSVLFGALDKYMIRKVKDLSVLRLVERYAEFGVVGFLGFARYDGNLLDAGTHPVKYLTNPQS